MKTIPYFPAGKTKIGILYQPKAFVYRDRDGTYCAKMPEPSRDAIRLQQALIDSGKIRPTRIIRTALMNLAPFCIIIAGAIWGVM